MSYDIQHIAKQQKWIVDKITHYIEADRMLNRSVRRFTIEEIKVVQTKVYRSGVKRGKEILVGWKFTMPVNPKFTSVTADLFNSFFHRDDSIDKLFDFSVKLVPITSSSGK